MFFPFSKPDGKQRDYSITGWGDLIRFRLHLPPQMPPQTKN